MTDLVDRLRATDGTLDITTILDRCNEAADEIERLRNAMRVWIAFKDAEIERLRAQIVASEDLCLAAAIEMDRLRAALEEMVQVNAAFARTIVTAAATDDLKDELRAAGIADGFGERARAALGEPKP